MRKGVSDNLVNRLSKMVLVATTCLATMWVFILPSAWAAKSPVSLTVAAYDTLGGGRDLWSVIINDQQQILDLITRIKALPHWTGRHCPLGDDSYYELSFGYPSGETSIIRIERTGCRIATWITKR